MKKILAISIVFTVILILKFIIQSHLFFPLMTLVGFLSFGAGSLVRKFFPESELKTNWPGLFLFVIVFIGIILSVVLGEPIRGLQRVVAVNRAEKIIVYLDEYKSKNGKYPEDINIKDIISPLYIGTIDGYSYYPKSSFSGRGDYFSQKDFKKKNDFYELRFVQGVGLLDFYYVIYRSDHDYSNVERDLKDAPLGWKYYFRPF